MSVESGYSCQQYYIDAQNSIDNACQRSILHFTFSAKRTKQHIKLIRHAHDVTQTNKTKTPETTNERKS